MNRQQATALLTTGTRTPLSTRLATPLKGHLVNLVEVNWSWRRSLAILTKDATTAVKGVLKVFSVVLGDEEGLRKTTNSLAGTEADLVPGFPKAMDFES